MVKRKNREAADAAVGGNSDTCTVKTSLKKILRPEIPFMAEAIEATVTDATRIMKSVSEIMNLILVKATWVHFEKIDEYFLMHVAFGVSRTLTKDISYAYRQEDDEDELIKVRNYALNLFHELYNEHPNPYPIHEGSGLGYLITSYITCMKNHSTIIFWNRLRKWVKWRAMLDFPEKQRMSAMTL